MGNSQVPYFAVEAINGSVIQVTLTDWSLKDAVLATYVQEGKIFPGAPVIDHPDLPSTPSHRWRIRNGVVVDDPTIPDPPHPRQALLNQVNQATTVAQLKALLFQIVDKGL